jgi:hypothetical protein
LVRSNQGILGLPEAALALRGGIDDFPVRTSTICHPAFWG